MIENYLLSFTLIISIITQGLYIASTKKKSLLKWANNSYTLSVASLISVSIALFANIVAHNFQISYVYEYSSKALPKFLLYASFFAGQEGSFVLWALMIAVTGIGLKLQIKGKDLEIPTMMIFNSILLLFILLIVVKSPFTYIWDKYPDRFAVGVMPPDGRSLNPILENFWMIIHPPFLFLGYSLLAAPFALGLASFSRREYYKWINIARNWQIIGSGILGIGLILGGFWAYESLGWGGWWGWDPVENASLVPWLVSVALIHTFLLQQRNKTFVKSNLFLVSIQFILIVYSTFLTRTGILQNSMHTFAGTSESVFYLLLIAMALMLIYTIIVLIRCRKEIPNPEDAMPVLSRDFFVSVGVFIVLIITMFVFYGTSVPIFDKDIAIEPSFYDKVNFIPAIIAMLSIAVSLIMQWKKTHIADVKKFATSTLLLSLIISAISFVVFNQFSTATNLFSSIVFVFSAALAMSAAIITLVSNSIKRTSIAAPIAHIGIAMMLIAVIFSGRYSEKKVMTLTNNESAQLGNYTFKYIKSEQIEKHLIDREKYHFIIEAKQNNSPTFLMPIMFIKDKQIYKEPAIKSQAMLDIYISPLSLDSTIQAANALLGKLQKVRINGTDIEFTFRNFVLPKMDDGEIGAEIEYTTNSQRYIDTIFTQLDMNTLECKLAPKLMNGTNRLVGINKIAIDNNNQKNTKVHFVFPLQTELPIQKKETFTFEASTKPSMTFIWIGSLLAIIGTLLGYRRIR